MTNNIEPHEITLSAHWRDHELNDNKRKILSYVHNGNVNFVICDNYYYPLHETLDQICKLVGDKNRRIRLNTYHLELFYPLLGELEDFNVKIDNAGEVDSVSFVYKYKKKQYVFRIQNYTDTPKPRADRELPTIEEDDREGFDVDKTPAMEQVPVIVMADKIGANLMDEVIGGSDLDFVQETTKMEEVPAEAMLDVVPDRMKEEIVDSNPGIIEETKPAAVIDTVFVEQISATINVLQEVIVDIGPNHKEDVIELDHNDNLAICTKIAEFPPTLIQVTTAPSVNDQTTPAIIPICGSPKAAKYIQPEKDCKRDSISIISGSICASYVQIARDVKDARDKQDCQMLLHNPTSTAHPNYASMGKLHNMVRGLVLFIIVIAIGADIATKRITEDWEFTGDKRGKAIQSFFQILKDRGRYVT